MDGAKCVDGAKEAASNRRAKALRGNVLIYLLYFCVYFCCVLRLRNTAKFIIFDVLFIVVLFVVLFTV